MAGYVPWYGKKRDRLDRRVEELRSILDQGGGEQEVVDAVEEVRASRIRFLKSERARIPPCGLHDVRLAQLDREIQRWRAVPIDGILADYAAKPTDRRKGEL
jgi:hypothetical protein